MTRDSDPAFMTASARLGVRLRGLALIGAVATWLVSMVALALLFVGRNWLWFGAGTAAAILAIHIVTNHIALGLGGTSLLAYVARRLRRPDIRNDGA